mgnify:FL=1
MSEMDYGDEKPSKYELLPEGDYVLKIREVAMKKTKETKLDMAVVSYDVFTPIKYKGRQVNFHNVVFSPPGAPGAGRFLYWLQCINQPCEGRISPNMQNWAGQKIAAHVGIREYEGKKYNEVKTFDRYVSGGDTEAMIESPEEIPF